MPKHSFDNIIRLGTLHVGSRKCHKRTMTVSSCHRLSPVQADMKSERRTLSSSMFSPGHRHKPVFFLPLAGRAKWGSEVALPKGAGVLVHRLQAKRAARRRGRKGLRSRPPEARLLRCWGSQHKATPPDALSGDAEAGCDTESWSC